MKILFYILSYFQQVMWESVESKWPLRTPSSGLYHKLQLETNKELRHDLTLNLWACGSCCEINHTCKDVRILHRYKTQTPICETTRVMQQSLKSRWQSHKRPGERGDTKSIHSWSGLEIWACWWERISQSLLVPATVRCWGSEVQPEDSVRGLGVWVVGSIIQVNAAPMSGIQITCRTQSEGKAEGSERKRSGNWN